jgi:hypothetical protein
MAIFLPELDDRVREAYLLRLPPLSWLRRAVRHRSTRIEPPPSATAAGVPHRFRLPRVATEHTCTATNRCELPLALRSLLLTPALQ